MIAAQGEPKSGGKIELMVELIIGVPYVTVVVSGLVTKLVMLSSKATVTVSGTY